MALCQEPKLDENPEHERGAEPNEDFESCTEANLDVNTGEAPGQEGISAARQDPMTAKGIHDKDTNTMESNNKDLEPIKDERAALGKKYQSNEASDGGPVNSRVSKPSDRYVLDEERVLSPERLQMSCAVDTFPERSNSSNEPTVETTEISPCGDADNNADDDCASTAHLSNDHSIKSNPAVILADVAQEPSYEAEQEAPESLEEKRSRKKRRRRRYKVKNHHKNSRKDHGTLRPKHSRSSGNGTSRRSRKQGPGHGSNKPARRNHRIKRIRSRHGILQRLLSVFYTTKRLFCG